MSNYLNHLVARSLNLIDIVQPLLVSVFEPLSEFAGLVEETDFNREQLPVTDTSKENNFETGRQARISTGSDIEQPLKWRSPATSSISGKDLYTTGSASLNIEPHSVTTDIFDPNENRYNLQTPDELSYPRSLDLTPTRDRDSIQLPTSNSQLAEITNSELSPSQPLSKSVGIPPTLEEGLPSRDRQPLTPTIEPETNATLSSPAAEPQQQPAPELSQKQSIEINRVVSSSESSEEVSSQPSSSQLRPESVVIQPATDEASLLALDRQPLTPAVETQTNTSLTSLGIGLQQQPVSELLQKQPIETNRVAFSSPSPEVMSSQLSPNQSRPEPIEILPAPDRVSPAPDKQLPTETIVQATPATPSSFSTEQYGQPVPESAQQPSVEINRVVSLLHTSHPSGGQLSPNQLRPELVVIQPATDAASSLAPNRQLLTPAIDPETNAFLASPTAEPQQQPAPKLPQKQPIEINRIVSISESSEEVSLQPFSSQLRPELVVIQHATDAASSPAPNRQLLTPTPAIESETNTTPSSPDIQLQQQSVPELSHKQPIEINRVVSTSESSKGASSQPSFGQPQPEPVVIQPITDTERVLSSSDRQSLNGAIALETPAAPSSLSAQQQQLVAKSEKQPSIEINRVVSLLQTSHQSAWQLSPSQPQPEPVVIPLVTEKMSPTPDGQQLAPAIERETNAALSSTTKQLGQPAPESEKQRPLEINWVAFFSQLAESVSSQLPPDQTPSEPVVMPPATEGVLPTSDRRPLTPAIASETLVTPSSLGAEQQRQPVPESSQKRPIEINRVVSSSHSLQVVSRQPSNTARLVKSNTGDPPKSPFSRGTYIPPLKRGARGDRSYPSSIGQPSPSQPQSEPGAIQPATERVSRTPDKQALTPAIEAKTNAALSIPAAERQKQPALGLLEIQQQVINRIVSSAQPPAVAPSPERSFIQTSDSDVLAVSTSQLSVTPHKESTEIAAARLSAIPTPNPAGQPTIASVVVQPEVSFSSSNLPNSRRHESRTRDEGSTSSEFTEIPQRSPTKTPFWIDKANQESFSPFDIAPVRFSREELPQQRESSPDSATPQTVQVTIGRLEIRATPPPAPPRPKPRPAPAVMSLDEYLRRRARRR